MAGKSKDKPKVKRPARPRNNNKTPAPAPVPANGAKISKRAASSSRKTPSASNSASKTSSTTASPAPQPASGLKREDRDASTPSSVASQEAVKEFYAHLEAASSESSRWDTDSVLGAVLEDLTDETGTPGGELSYSLVPLHPLSLFPDCSISPCLLFPPSSHPPLPHQCYSCFMHCLCCLFVLVQQACPVITQRSCTYLLSGCTDLGGDEMKNALNIKMELGASQHLHWDNKHHLKPDHSNNN